MAPKQLIRFLGLLALVEFCSAQALYRVCYYDNTAQYHADFGRFLPENIDPALCNHIVFSRAFLRGGSLIVSEHNDEDMYQRVMAHRSTDPDLKILLAVETSQGQLGEMTDMLTDASTRANFIDAVIVYLETRDFDGIHLDFKYPGYAESPPEDKERFSFLVQEMRAAFDANARTRQTPLLLAAAVPARTNLVDNGYEPDVLGENLDFISVMSMELNNPWEKNVTGHNSPLLSIPTDVELSVEYAMHYWASFGIPRSKLLMGIPLYAVTYKLTTSEYGVGAPADGPGPIGPETRSPGYLSYTEVCNSFTNGNPRYWDNTQRVPFMIDNVDGVDRWSGYENQESLFWKVDHMSTRGYGGYTVQSFDMDDFRGSCRFTKFYLLKYLSERTLEIPTTTSTTTTTTTTTTPKPVVTTEQETTTVQETTTEQETTTVQETTESPEVTTEAEPDITTIIWEFETTEIEEVPEFTTEGGEQPEVTTEGGEQPEVTTEGDEQPEVTTEGGEQPEVTTKGDEVPEPTTQELPNSTPPFKSCNDKPHGFMMCDPNEAEYFWTCDNGVAIRRICAPGTVCNEEVATCTPPEEIEGRSTGSFFSWLLNRVRSLGGN